MKGRSCPDLTASFGDDFGQFGGIFLSCQLIWTDLACLLSLPTWFLSIFTHKSIWHLFECGARDRSDNSLESKYDSPHWDYILETIANVVHSSEAFHHRGVS